MPQSVLVLFGQSVRLARKKLGLTQEELAERSRLHRTYLGGIERGERNPSLINIALISSALGTTPAALLSEISEGELASLVRQKRAERE